MGKKLRLGRNQHEWLGYFAEGLLSPPEEKEASRLVNDDPALREEVRVQKEIAQLMAAEEPPAVPDHVVQKAKDLVSEPFGARVWNVLVRFTKEAVWSLKSDGIFMDPAFVPGEPVRGQGNDRPRPVLVSKDFGSVRIQMEIEREKNAANRIVIFAQDLTSENPVNDLRITLLEDDTELESHITYKGKINFENVNDGRYTFDISAPNRPIARITLEIFHE